MEERQIWKLRLDSELLLLLYFCFYFYFYFCLQLHSCRFLHFHFYSRQTCATGLGLGLGLRRVFRVERNLRQVRWTELASKPSIRVNGGWRMVDSGKPAGCYEATPVGSLCGSLSWLRLACRALQSHSPGGVQIELAELEK